MIYTAQHTLGRNYHSEQLTGEEQKFFDILVN